MVLRPAWSMVRVTSTLQPARADCFRFTCPTASCGLARISGAGGPVHRNRSETSADTLRACGPPSSTTSRWFRLSFHSPTRIRPSLSPKNSTVMEVPVYRVAINTGRSVLFRKTRLTSGQLTVASMPSG